MRRATMMAFPAAALAALAACSGGERAASDTAGGAGGTTAAAALASPPMTAQRLGETSGLKTPESVRYDEEQDLFFVSNIDGNPSQKDGKGAIMKVRADSLGAATPFIEGGKKGVTLNAPKGLTIQGDTLWVADIDAVRGFDRHTGAPVRSIDLGSQKATFLNDVVVGGDGALYVTDTGIAFDAGGQMSHPGVNRIFRISGTTVAEAAKGDSLAGPNGIAWDEANGRFLVASFTGKDVLSWTPGSAAPSTFASGPGSYDGIEVLADGTVLVTSWADSAVHAVRNGQMTVIAPNTPGPADIGLDTKRKVLAVPLFSDNKVAYFQLK